MRVVFWEFIIVNDIVRGEKKANCCGARMVPEGTTKRISELSESTEPLTTETFKESRELRTLKRR